MEYQTPENELKRKIRRLYEEGWGQGDLAAIDEVFAPQHILHWHDQPPSDQVRTADEVKRIVQDYRAAFPDLRVTLDYLLVEGERAAVQVTFAGTHMGEYEGFAPTRQFGRFTDMQILRFEGGKLVESSLPSGGLRHFFAILDGSLYRES